MTPRFERLALTAADGPDALAARLRGAVAEPKGLRDGVAATIAAIEARGDEALAELGERFDGVGPEALRVPAERLESALAEIPGALREALELAAANVRAVAEAQLPVAPAELTLPQGQRVVVDSIPVRAAGIYAPGGRAAYPSSVLMGTVPARVAGVSRIAVVSPPGADGWPAAAVLAAASMSGADEVYACGGAQAIAALALGTESIRAVDVIAGPGGPWVQEAKRQLAGRVGIDAHAGPSELMVIADERADAEWVALDVCAQAEHGTDGLLVVVSASEVLLDAVEERIAALAAERPSVAAAPVHLVAAPGLEDALALGEALAPEHLELAVEGAAALSSSITTAGCVFVGNSGATAFGDYAAGSNHVLPTGGAGRFSGPLGPGTFRRSISRVDASNATAELGSAVDEIARAEGFPVHGESARARRIDRGEDSGDGTIG
jgi:histidinol dehydrogenase